MGLFRQESEILWLLVSQSSIELGDLDLAEGRDELGLTDGAHDIIVDFEEAKCCSRAGLPVPLVEDGMHETGPELHQDCPHEFRITAEEVSRLLRSGSDLQLVVSVLQSHQDGGCIRSARLLHPLDQGRSKDCVSVLHQKLD